jgi:hypothetical protein
MAMRAAEERAYQNVFIVVVCLNNPEREIWNGGDSVAGTELHRSLQSAAIVAPRVAHLRDGNHPKPHFSTQLAHRRSPGQSMRAA